MNYPPYYQPSYQPYAPPMMDQLAQLRAQQPAPNPMIWVQGEAAAKSYLVAAGNTVPLWDSENMCIYYTERTKPAPAQQTPEYVTRAEFEAFAAQFTPKKTAKKAEVTENE